MGLPEHGEGMFLVQSTGLEQYLLPAPGPTLLQL